MSIKIKYISAVIILVVLFGVAVLFAFDWPQKPVEVGALFSEIRGGNFNTGIVFDKPGEVAVAEDGRVLMTMKNDSSSMGLFESPLGNAVIVDHRSDMLSVYSNLVNIKVTPSQKNLVAGDIIGVSGSSAWKDGDEGVGFQLIDTKIKTLINPAVLIQEVPDGRNVPVVGVKAVSRTDESFSVYNGAVLSSGSYTLYMTRPQTGMMHTSSVALNGEVKETVTYDTLKQNKNTLTVAGNKPYPFSAVYPEDTSMRLAEIILPRGINTIEISLTNVGDTQSYARYRISVD